MKLLFTVTFFTSLILSTGAHAIKLKFAVLAPKQTSWGKSLVRMTKEIKKATNKATKKQTQKILKTYFIDTKILTWFGKKPLKNIQSIAREKRYQLLFSESDKFKINNIKLSACFAFLFNKGSYFRVEHKFKNEL